MDALRLLSRSTGLKSQIAKAQPHNIPSASGGTKTQSALDLDTGLTRKRKRNSEASENGFLLAEKPDVWPEQAIRQLQKRQKIKIVDLNQFRAAGESAESRKTQKEQSRIFPQPLTSFDLLHTDYKVNSAITRNIADQSYFEPTDVQTATLPLLLRRGVADDAHTEPDVLTIAPTGSGKTLAFLIPLIDKVARSHHEAGGGAERHIRAIILAPTKELVTQIVNEGRKLAANTGVSITAIRKGMRLFEKVVESGTQSSGDAEPDQDSGDDPSERNSTATIVKTDVLVSTPLSLVHLLCPSWDEDETLPPQQPLPNIESLILDEADVLLDPLFRSQTLAIWSACISPSLRISMWSATIGSNVEELAVQTIVDRQKTLRISKRRRPPLLRTIVGLKDTSLPTISHRLVYTGTESGKLLGVRQLLRPSRSVSASPENGTLRPPFLVFTQTIVRAQSLYSELQYDIPAAAGGASRVAVLHSTLSDSARSSIMKNFREGKIWVLITTDLLSRGVDFKGVNAVVNYDIPTTVAGYIHRAGRTGRAGRAGGVCVTFYTKEDIQYVKGIANVISASESAQAKSVSGAMSDNDSERIPAWLLHALPSVSKSTRKDLKRHGVESRRAIHADDDEKTKRMKRKARIGTQSGHERRETDRKRGAVERSRRAKGEALPEKEPVTEWEGFG